MSYKKQNYNRSDRSDRRRYDRNDEDWEPKPRREYELEKLQTTLAYANRDIRDLRASYNKLLRFALEQQLWDKEMVDRLGKPYLPHAPGVEELQPEPEETDVNTNTNN